ncbi:MAG: hypothetical protein UX87_C0007G0029 [Candidatus Amesbacteria bacterium GW2011_GWA1_47_16]|uniref:Uncharacterized protein n=3 Tax=Candidatus Amesiibacteriota TaxID=1752730 RepID=A0A0G1XUS9_9BACT|nr:MAG: hypothetical protein UX87_C0007G0029 [Candidatus Amesbacteria bacterium GW2011_GWA1_47_16]KKU98065.1 MAG: hypothetical protein UY28_C0008G0011 [Candidatus Amesbacteria bacterium GW2011_GWB1_48_13]OGD01062.1 MAG: hypothetical protein A2972_03060 [Candidatus Amesbacteria bacterium RIFCSPLOWO2_01_FULL_47_33]
MENCLKLLSRIFYKKSPPSEPGIMRLGFKREFYTQISPNQESTPIEDLRPPPGHKKEEEFKFGSRGIHRDH